MHQKRDSKRILLANDLAGIGKVALSNAIPIMACAEIETGILPTVILSSHTGGFPDIFIDDYTRGMLGFLKQWRGLPLRYDAIVTGYLKSQEQIDILLAFSEEAKQTGTLLIVDPIMADNGSFYSGFDQAYAEKMKVLCQSADYLIPNISEACILTGTELRSDARYSEAEIDRIVGKLPDFGSKRIIITGIAMRPNELGTAFYNPEAGCTDYVFTPELPHKFYGTGDLFTSILSACAVKGIDLKRSLEFAVAWLDSCLRYTLEAGRDLRYGVLYEPFLKDFIEGIRALEREEE